MDYRIDRIPKRRRTNKTLIEYKDYVESQLSLGVEKYQKRILEESSFSTPVKRREAAAAAEDLPTPLQPTPVLEGRIGQYTTEKIYKPSIQYGEDSRNLLIDLVRDGKAVDIIEDKNFDNDLDWVGIFNIGKFAEIYASINMKCPCCGEKELHLFKNPNMPVIDLVCTNSKHDLSNGPKYWQVKASKGDLYFSKELNYISVGSKKWGLEVHNINLENKLDNEYQIGYICLKVDVIGDDETNLKLNLEKSFIVLPNSGYYYLSEEDEIYKSREIYSKHPAISWMNNDFVLDIVQFLDIKDEDFNNYNFNINSLLSYYPETIQISEQKSKKSLFGGVYKIRYTQL